MGSHTLELSPRPELFSEPGADPAHHFFVDSHCVVQLGTVVNEQALVINELVTLRHDRLPPLYNLSLESEAVPTWASGLTIQAIAPVIPPPPGPGPPIPFLPSLDPQVLPAAYVLLPSPLIDPFTLAVYAANLSPGGFGHYSIPGTTTSLRIQGTVPVGTPPGLYRHRFFVKGSLLPVGTPSLRVGVIHVGVIVQVKDVFQQIDQIPPELQVPPP